MDIKNLTLFIDVARQGNFAAAARQQDLDPSSVSRSIASLEQELGLRLFQRSTRKLTLTEAGAVYLSRLEDLLGELDQARDEAQALSLEPSGTLRLTCSTAYGQECVLPLIGHFQEQYPHLKLDLLFRDDNVDLIEERIDLAIRLAPSISDDLICSKLHNTHYHVCASPQYIQDKGRPSQPEDLNHHTCINYALPDFGDSWRFKDDKGLTKDIRVSGKITISNALALRAAVKRDLGPGLLADWLVEDDLKTGEMVDLFPAYTVTATSFDTAAWLLYPSRNYLPNKVRVAIDFLRKHLA